MQLLYFGATWCVPCKTMKPIIGTLAGKHKIPIAFYDIEIDVDMAIQYTIYTVPTIIKICPEGEIGRISGMQNAYTLESFIRE